MLNKATAGTGLLIAIALFLGINIISNETLTSLRLDVTENKLFTLSDGTVNILGELEEPVRLRFYYSAKLFAGVPQYLNYGKRVRDMLEEYVAESGGKLELQVIDPEPFSEAEDQAVSFGIRQLPFSASGEMAYLGLAGTNSTDDEDVIPFLSPDREDALEYDITKMVYTLANPRKRVIGVLSGLPVFGGPANPATGAPGQPWTVITVLEELFETRELGTDISSIDEDVDTLMLIHPKELPRSTQYAVDQFILRGGKAIIFVDPLAEEDSAQPNPEAPMVIPDTSSDLPELFGAWGISLVEEKVVGDRLNAIRVSYRGSRGPQEIEYLPWLRFETGNLDDDDFITNQLNVINMGSAGTFTVNEDAAAEVTPLIYSSRDSMLIDKDAVLFVRDPSGLLENFEPDQVEHVIAARINGMVKTAFPDGRPMAEGAERAPPDQDFVAESSEPINLIVVADTDILADRFWVQVSNFLGMQVPNPIADNANFLINALDNLGGNDDLISLRSRGEYARPFEVVEEIQRDAEAQFRDRERELQAKLQETEAKIAEMQSSQDGSGELLLSADQRGAIDEFRAEQVRTRKELRNVQHELQKNIERLGAQLKVINIGLIPLLIAAFAIGSSVLSVRRRRRGA